MKYGLWYFKNTHNIGDDIWAYAQSLFYPHIDYLIDNIAAYKFKSANGEEVATIIAAFVEPYNHEYAFAPPINVNPLFVSSYFRSTMWEFIKKDFVRNYLKAHEPIGVRSQEQANRLREMDIEAYFSGCITLTLPELNKKEGDYICCVDVPDYVIDYVRKAVKGRFEIKKMTHIALMLNEENSHYIRDWEPEFQRAVTCEQRNNLSISQRFEIARSLVQFYCNAHCVVTSRLHAALPCLSQKTSVLLALPNNGEGINDMGMRCADFLPFVHHSSYENFLEGTVDFDFVNPPDNPAGYLLFRNNLSAKCSEFIRNCEDGNIANRCPYTTDQRQLLLIELLENKILQLKNIVDAKNRLIKDAKAMRG